MRDAKGERKEVHSTTFDWLEQRRWRQTPPKVAHKSEIFNLALRAGGWRIRLMMNRYAQANEKWSNVIRVRCDYQMTHFSPLSPSPFLLRLFKERPEEELPKNEKSLSTSALTVLLWVFWSRRKWNWDWRMFVTDLIVDHFHRPLCFSSTSTIWRQNVPSFIVFVCLGSEVRKTCFNESGWPTVRFKN